MEILNSIQSPYRYQAPIALTADPDRPKAEIEGKGTVEPGKFAYYRVKTNAKNPKFKWTISTPEGNIAHADTQVIKVKPTKEGSLNLTVTVTGADGKWNEVVWTISVSRKK